MATDIPAEQSRRPFLYRQVAAILIAVGAYLILAGEAWAPFVLGALPNSSLGGWIELFVPFLPMIPIYVGALLASNSPS